MFCPFLDWVVFYIELHKLFVNFGDYSFVSPFICEYFLPFCELSFLLFMVSFSMQKLLNLIRSHMFIFVFIFIRGRLKKFLLQFILEGSVFSSNNFYCINLIFRFLIHFEFTFVYGVKVCCNFIHLHVAVKFSQHHLLKMLPFLHCPFLPLLS